MPTQYQTSRNAQLGFHWEDEHVSGEILPADRPAIAQKTSKRGIGGGPHGSLSRWWWARLSPPGTSREPVLAAFASMRGSTTDRGAGGLISLNGKKRTLECLLLD